MKLLLLSNSTAPGRGYLEHARDAIAWLLEGVTTVAFVPYAGADHDGYTAKVSEALAPNGVRVRGVHTGDPGEIVRESEAVFIGGGNTFRLVDRLHRHGLVEELRASVGAGQRYMGSSAGTNVATPSLKTTNDMPIVQPATFETLALVPFQINPHYLDPDPSSTHQGETRDTRLREYLEENRGPVLAMREGTWLRRDGGRLDLEGLAAGARLYRRGRDAQEIPAPAAISDLLVG